MSEPNYPPSAPHDPPQHPGYPPPQPQQGYPPPGWQPAPAYGAPSFTPRHKIPGLAVAASIIWIIYGGLALIGNLLTLAASGGRTGTPGFVGIAISVGFLVAGIQTLMGKAKGLMANGIVSIVLGGLAAVAFLLLGALIRGFHAPMVLILVGVLFGALLITAGILALMANKSYKEFRQTKGL
ncbi:MAG: hypothetical protein ABI867_00665 [Kofleriaceae bacterium]